MIPSETGNALAAHSRAPSSIRFRLRTGLEGMVPKAFIGPSAADHLIRAPWLTSMKSRRGHTQVLGILGDDLQRTTSLISTARQQV